MAVYKTVSIKEVIARIYRNIKLTDSSWEQDIYEWLWEGMEKCRVRTSLYSTSEVAQVKNHVAPLPCGLVVLDAVAKDGCRLTQSDTILDVPKIPTQNPILNSSTLFETSVQKVVTETTDKTTTITTTDSLYKYNVDHTTLPFTTAYYKLVQNKLQTSFKEGEIVFYFLKYETDENGIITIPDNESLKTALYWYIVTMMIGAGFEHPIFKYSDAEQRWEDFQNKAINSLRNWTPERAYDFQKMWVQLMPPSSSRHNDYMLNRNSGY